MADATARSGEYLGYLMTYEWEGDEWREMIAEQWDLIGQDSSNGSLPLFRGTNHEWQLNVAPWPLKGTKQYGVSL